MFLKVKFILELPHFFETLINLKILNQIQRLYEWGHQRRGGML